MRPRAHHPVPHLDGKHEGTRIKDFRKAGVPGRLRHDFRTTAVRNDGAGVFRHALANFDGMKGRTYNVGLSDANLSSGSCAR